jgi:pimeloyl-ACP methyl ester carboxylesterase
VLWCHGGPGSRLEPAYLRREASEAGLRIIGIDRPGYGLPAPQPGRTIADWVTEALAVAGHLGIGQFAAVGISTGGAYALALAALAPERVLGVVACCSMTDMRWPEGILHPFGASPHTRPAGCGRKRGGWLGQWRPRRRASGSMRT